MVKKNNKKAENKTKNKILGKSKSKTSPKVWNPFDIMDNFDRFYMEDPWTPNWLRSRRPLIPWYGNWHELDTKITPLDLVDSGDRYKVVAEVPGVLKKDLEVNITDTTISICGETKTELKREDEGYLRHERGYSTICRNIKFPEEVNPDKAEATLKDGILEVHVFKKKPLSNKGKKITVK
jgi:HSP20 family protein